MGISMKSLTRIYLLLGILLGIAGIVKCVRWSRIGDVVPGYLLIFLPSIVIGIIYFAGRNNDKKLFHAFAIPFCLLVIIFWGGIASCMETYLLYIAPVTSVESYEKILNERWRSEEALVRHFPEHIPADAQDVRFFFRPAFLQGGAAIQLCCRLPENSISTLYDRFSQMKTKSFFGGGINEHMNMKEGMPTTSFYTSGSNRDEFPADYEIMIYDKVLTEEDRPPGHYWNHGRSHGVAISKKNNEIVYWAESW
jgi:hypothetical protein